MKPRNVGKLIEEKFGKPSGEVLLELLNQGHTQQSIAELLGVKQTAISYHVRKAGITRTTKAIYVIEGASNERD